jgi:hypothetical protein
MIFLQRQVGGNNAAAVIPFYGGPASAVVLPSATSHAGTPTSAR